MKIRALGLVLLAALGCGDGGGGSPDAGPIDAAAIDAAAIDAAADAEVADPRFAAVTAAIEADRLRARAPGAAVAIIEGGRITFARGFGSKHPERAEPVTERTLFRIGSVTKALTAAVLLQLVAEGKVDLEASVTRVIPTLRIGRDPDAAASITVKHLLTHTSGIVDMTPIEGSSDDTLLEAFTAGEFAQAAYLMAPPGRFFNYSNPNFALCGLTLERAGGVPYRQAMKARLFDPLNMKRTFFLGSEVIADGDFAHGKTVDDAGKPRVIAPDSYDHAWSRPAGFATSSVLDLAAFVTFLLHGNDAVLPAVEREAMQSPQIDTRELLDLVHYGYGLQVTKGFFLGPNEFHALRYVTHNGAIPGFSAEIHAVPALDFAFVALANGDGATFIPSFVTALHTLAQLPPSDPRPVIAADPATFAKYEGAYNDEHLAGRIAVHKDGATLTISLPDADAAKIPYDRVLVATSPDNFVFTIDGDQLPVTFILDGAGQPEYLRTRAFVARRLPQEMPVPLARVVNRGRLSRAVHAAAEATRLMFPR